MAGAAVAEVHDGILVVLIDAVGVDSHCQVVRRTGAVAEVDHPLTAVQDLIKIIIRIVDDKGGCSGEVAVRPGIGQHMHGKACRRGAFSSGELNRLLHERAVGLADQAVFLLIAQPGLSGRPGSEIAGQKVKRRPDPCNILQTHQIGPGLHQFKLQLGRDRGFRSLDLCKEGA